VKRTIISSKASNWVDQGRPPQRVMRRVLAFLFNRHTPEDEPWLESHANTIVGMVAADASEVHVANYLRSLAPNEQGDTGRSDKPRLAGIALWHIAKAALVRDFAERVLQGDVPVNEPTPDSFSHWVASRLLTPEELARYEASRRETSDE
jgi:hypothetical protein